MIKCIKDNSKTFKTYLQTDLNLSLKFAIVSIIFLISIRGLAQPKSLSDYLSLMDNSPALKQANWGFCLISGENGKQISSFNSDKSLIPASVLKVVTTSSALKILGDTFRFKTQIFYTGIIKNGILNGDLIIKGYGNPVLGSKKGSNETIDQVFDLMAAKILSFGISEIKGNLVADVSYFEFEPVPSSWTWYDIGNYYAPQIGALNINENQYELFFKPGLKAGEKTTLMKTIPEIKDLKIINHTFTAIGGGDRTYIPGPPRSMEKHIYGQMPAGESFKVKGAMPQPELYFLISLRSALLIKGVKCNGVQNVSYNSAILNDTKLIYTHFSQPLSQICQYANYTSNNLTAECLLRTLGAEKKAEGSTKAGIEVIKSFISGKITNSNGINFNDGSGLSKSNLITPKQLTEFLYKISQEKWSQCFINSLPTAGSTGTLEKFCNGINTSGKIFAKSGSMERVKCYAGYVRDKQGTLNSFSIMVNNHHVPNKEIVDLIEGLMEYCVK